MSYAPWEPERLRTMNFVDAMALVRTRACALSAGTPPTRGCTAGRTTTCGAAWRARGWHGVSVPEIVGRYRVAAHSMLRSTTQLSNVDARSVLEERHPELMARALAG